MVTVLQGALAGRGSSDRALEDAESFEFSTEHFEGDSHRITKGD